VAGDAVSSRDLRKGVSAKPGFILRVDQTQEVRLQQEWLLWRFVGSEDCQHLVCSTPDGESHIHW
jgi:LAS superfamily LD-carboxypeptidase LdcB